MGSCFPIRTIGDWLAYYSWMASSLSSCLRASISLFLILNLGIIETWIIAFGSWSWAGMPSNTRMISSKLWNDISYYFIMCRIANDTWNRILEPFRKNRSQRRAITSNEKLYEKRQENHWNVTIFGSNITVSTKCSYRSGMRSWISLLRMLWSIMTPTILE